MPATYNIYVDWNNDGDFGDADEDISSLVKEASWTTGRDYASLLTGRAIAGSLTVVLKNSDDRFNSFNTASPLYGNTLPGRRVRVTMTVGVTTVTMFQGFLDSIDAQPELGIGGYIATLRAVAPLALVSQRKVNVPMQTSVGSGAAIGLILDEIGWPAGDRSIDTGETTLGRWWTGGKVDALNALVEVESDEMGFLRESKDGKIVFESRHHRLKTDHLTNQATFTDAAGATLGYMGLTQGDPLKEIYNFISAEIRFFTVQDPIGLLWALQDPNAVRDIAPGSSRTWWAQLPNPVAPTNAVAVDSWTTPVSGTDYLANSQSDGSGSNLTASISVAVSKFDTTMKIVITNNAAVTIYMTLLQARGAALLEQIPSRVVSEDAASQAKYGERSYPLPAKHLPNTSTGQDYIDFVKSIYKDPIPVLMFQYLATGSDARLIEARDRDVSDRIAIDADGTAGLGINQDFFVESISHFLKPGEHHVTYECSPATALGGFWILGTSALGSTTKLAY